MNEIRDVYLRLHDTVTVVNDARFRILYGVENSVTICLLHQFGWLRLEYDAKPNRGKAAEVRQIERTGFGDAMFVFASRHLGVYNDDAEDVFRAKLQPIFPAWTNRLTRSEPASREGKHTFKVSLGEIWRRIAAPSDAVLDELADAILTAFRFDSEHLYQFELRSAAGNSMCVVGPHIQDAKYFADAIRIGEVPLAIGDSMVFHYDFGDDWRFKVTLETVEEDNISPFQVTDKSGKPPQQYGRDNW